MQSLLRDRRKIINKMISLQIIRDNAAAREVQDSEAPSSTYDITTSIYRGTHFEERFQLRCIFSDETR